MSHPTQDEQFRTALRRFQLGLYGYAEHAFGQICAANPHHADARYFMHLARRRLNPKPAARPTLVWQFDPAQAWETDWLRFLIGGTVAREVVDNTWTHIADPMIVVDNRLVPEKLPYYRQAFEQGARIVLIHLSDEAFMEDRVAYRYCEHVLRNYWSERIADSRRVSVFPLGYKAGFVQPGTVPPLAARKHLWAFAGDVKKLTRADMLKAMQSVGAGRSHLTEGFGTADNLSTADYRAMMLETVIAPCPSGWGNLETFRVYEALEAGCIPIVEARPGFDYFAHLLGPHPLPTVFAWAEAPALIRRWQADDSLAAVAERCHSWWRGYKESLQRQMQSSVLAACGFP